MKINTTRISRTFIPAIVALFAAFASGSCIEDGFSSSPSDQPRFATDTLDLGLIFTDEASPTSRMVVYNPHPKGLNISRIAITGPDAGHFRMNVDGLTGESFSDVEIRAKDSIFVLVEATLPENAGPAPTKVKASLDFTTNGVTRSVVISATGQNVKRLRAITITTDTRFTAEIPYQIFDSLVVAPGAALTLEPGARLYFHDKASLIVRGSLRSLGTPEAPVNMCGDRTGNVVSDISFDIMSNQWTGAFFTATSKDNILSHTDIRNTRQGVTVYEAPLTIINSRLHNSGGCALEAYHARIRALGSEFAEAGDGLVYLQGGEHLFTGCTFANNYLFSAIANPAISLAHVSADPKTGADDGSGFPYMKAEFNNSIIYGLGSDFSHGSLEGTDVRVRRCLIKAEGVDDNEFVNCIWGEDPLYYTVRADYLFDYRLKPDSPAIDAADRSLFPADFPACDFYGVKRRSDLGAYTFTEPADQ
ncbi:MAG: hypothetical protein K2M06_07630 [Muribaculaceae bacterium]|nr:hypothetical protein [Muribaculaceae bacterium]